MNEDWRDELITKGMAVDAIMERDQYAEPMECAEAIKALPSAQPQRIKGRWTKAYDGHDGHVKCVQCFKTYDWDTQAQYYNFCPNCGAEMETEQQ